jgi:hypothetical protein
MRTCRPSEAKSGDLAGAPVVEITPAMIEAGVRVLWESGAIENPNDDFDRGVIRKIFLAFRQAQS